MKAQESKKSYLSFLIVTLLMSVLFLQFPTQTEAEGISLKVNPSLIQIRTQTPSDVRAPFIIENQSDQSVKLKIGYKLFDPTNSQQGKVAFLDEPGSKGSIFDHIQILDIDNTPINTLDLGPKQQKQLEIRVVLPENQPASDYYFSLIFLEDIIPQTGANSTIKEKKDQHTITTIQGGIATNVLLAVGPSETPQGYIEEFSAPWYVQAGPVPFTLKVKNSGMHYINPRGTIIIKNLFGQTVGKVEIPATAILAGTTRGLIDDKQLAKAVNPTNDPKVIWPERFLIGLYSANLMVSIGDDAPFYNQSIRFFAFPLHILLIAVVVIGIMISIYIKVKKRLS